EVCCRTLSFFFQAEDGIRDWSVTGVQTCALPISALVCAVLGAATSALAYQLELRIGEGGSRGAEDGADEGGAHSVVLRSVGVPEIGRASGRERGEDSGGGGVVKKKEGRETRQVG